MNDFFNRRKRFKFSIKLEKSKKWAEAAESYIQIVSLSKSTPAKWLYRCAFALYKAQRWAESEKYLALALQKRPKKAQWHYRYSLVLRHLGRLTEAEVALEQAIRLNPKAQQRWGRSMPLWRKLENLQQQVNTWQDRQAHGLYRAFSNIKHKLGLGVKDAARFSQLADALEKMNRFSEAAYNYGQAIKCKGGRAPASWYYYQGYCYERAALEGEDTLELARQSYDLAQSKYPVAQRFGVGVFHQEKGRWPEAQQAYLQKIKTAPADAELYYRLGMSYDRCYDWAQAERYYRQSVALDAQQANRLFRLGFVLERQENYTEAVQFYELANQARSTPSPYYRYRQAYCLEHLALYEPALQMYLDSLVIELRPVDDEQGKAELLAVLAVDNTDANVWYKLAGLYEQQENWSEAESAYRHAVMRKNTHQPEWYYRWGRALGRLGRYAEACSALRNTRLIQKASGLPDTKLKKDKGFNQISTYTECYERESVQGKTVLYESFHGAAMSCNPYAMFLSLWKQDTEQQYLHIWVINHLELVDSRFKNQPNIIFVRRDSDLYASYLATAHYLINNNTFPPYFIRKAEQKYLNTWHGTPLKTLGKDIKEGFFEHQNVTRNFLQATHLLSPNPHTTQVLVEQHDVSEILPAQLLELGYPRIDLTLDMRQADRLREQLALDATKRVVLYAPTYRGSTQQGQAQLEEAPINALLTALSADPSLEVFFKGHHMIEAALAETGINARIVPAGIDTNVFLSVVDVLITDYSSIMFDFLPRKKPIVLYAYDYEEYVNQRGLYIQAEQIPGVLCATVAEVVEQVSATVCTVDERVWQQHMDSYCPFDDGQVTNRVWAALLDASAMTAVKNEKIAILLYAGALMLNGITVSLKNLVINLDATKYDVYLALEPRSFVTADQFEQLESIRPYVKILPKFGRVNWTLEEYWLMERFHAWHKLPCAEMISLLTHAYQREAKRLYGAVQFDAVINFEGYVRYWTLLFSTLPNNRIYLHNDMVNEWKARFPNQESVFNLYDDYGKLISVSSSTNEQNKQQLADRYQIAASKFVYADNMLNPEAIINNSQQDLSVDIQAFVSDAKPLFINMARLSIEKGHDQLIRAFRAVVDKQPLAKLLIVGGGPLMEELEALIQSLDLANNVMLTGLMSNPFPCLAVADCFVFSSKHEGQGLVLLEAMVLHKPIICTDFPCAHDVLEQGKYGVIVENSSDGLEKAMLDFLQQPMTFSDFDVGFYQKQALNQFEGNVLH